MLKDHNYLTINQLNEQFMKARNSIGICDDTEKAKILVSGEMALQLINHFSIVKVDEKITNNFYTILLKKKKFISEVLVLRLSLYRYLIVTDELKKVIRLLKRKRRKFPLAVIRNATNEYSIFSFHGENANNFFRDIDYRYIYKTKHQDYTYYQLICPKREQDITYKHFLKMNFIPISIELKKLFLYNNNVVLNIKNIPRSYRLGVCAEIYPNNVLKCKVKSIEVKKYELEGNYLVTNKHKVYSYLRKKAGIIHCIFRLPNRKYPYIIAFVMKNKARKVSLVKIGKQDAIIRPILNY